MTTTTAVSFSQIADELSKAISNIEIKKKAFDEVSSAVSKASNEYQEAINNAQSLRDMLNKSLNDTMGDPSNSGRVRQSS